ncbi:MAG: helix-turn-helix domain-containing protein [Acidimicrobiia bacterium]|nr:helix-turn-helix domain-containing protein [Acidimicrobiia bacterium]MBT8247796.1 helix-turn-helix domain-containing protein [Acidimicrobiia bacterium]NNL12247.1 helix-turn-helix domain-containing protein [Acidimicrobiia bacterium]
MLTTKDLQELINVDRSTIYRMAESGKLPAIKVGRQWRFPAQEIEAWLAGGETAASTPLPRTEELPVGDLADMLLPGVTKPLADLLGNIFGVMVLVTDLDGQPLVEPANPCGLFKFVHDHPTTHPLCAETWRELGADPDRIPRFRPTPLGFECARGFIRVGPEVKGMVIMGGIAPSEWPPAADQVRGIAADLGVPADSIADHIDEVFYLDRSHQAWVLEYLPRISSLFSRIARERSRLVDRLDTIASLAGSTNKGVPK